MEHQVFVPVPAEDLRAVLRDPARVARCVPGLQQDADAAAGPTAGRLKLRVGGHTVTYRGALTVAEGGPDRFTAEGAGTEVRGHGTVTLSVGLTLVPDGGGTRLEFTCGATADGRAAAFAPEATAVAGRRLLDRVGANLAAEAAAASVVEVASADGSDVDGSDAGARDVGARDAGARDSDPHDPVAEAEEAADAEGAGDAGDATGPADAVSASVFDTDVPAPSLDPFLEGDFGEAAGPAAAARPPAEAAHARRTMIGRSAEEVDHAPPRGRYAPVPAPSTVAAAGGLRWVAPAAALAIASAVVVGRALRRRR
ncbi:SRPBCC domain-containing protein [Streptomyces sp. Isolate_45]|uniref:SRPBCC family protein n=1 Tax=Streptomyces sp. Isolate_45 TaxID=2950111 RepID=UPI0024820847|nr:SRPBCC domain-containing protein [Streptomyces sp. Isolate_45]MDA5283617.1 SRPBCC domain-containing protein [Streptomyces sp. Isolate_45]